MNCGKKTIEKLEMTKEQQTFFTMFEQGEVKEFWGKKSCNKHQVEILVNI